GLFDIIKNIFSGL
uniref:Dahlein-1.2 n=1 Tax=Ranoidea dahlii TaxID=299727 RepID=DAH12_RANDH|nr:RecName: Full=Dahlein-1.2 [Ranoidea dahlii]